MTCESHSQFLGKSCLCNFSPDRVIERMGVKQWLLSYVKKLAWVHKKLKVDWQTNLQILPIRGNHPHITPWMAHILLVIADVIIDNFIFHLLQMEFWIFNLAVSYLRLTFEISLWLSDKESACQAGNMGSIPELGRSPAEGNGNLLQYSYQDREAWQATVHVVT